MPLSAEERQAVLSNIGVILEQDIHGKLQDMYGAAVALTEKQPDQVNNEVRNAVTHLSRALAAETAEQAAEEMSKASSHVERAMRDCLKLCVIELHDRIQSALRQIEMGRGTLDAALVVRRNQLTEQRKATFRAETNGQPVLGAFVELFNDATSFEEELTEQFHLVQGKTSLVGLIIVRLKRSAAEVILGIVAGIIGGLALALLVPDLTEFGKKAQIHLHLRKPDVSSVQPTNAVPVSPTGSNTVSHSPPDSKGD